MHGHKISNGKMDIAVQHKIDRLKRGEKPRVLDLFAGCGGISLGFHTAGYSLDAAVEFDPIAALSHALNFHSEEDEALFEKHAEEKDIIGTSPDELVGDLALGNKELAFDVIVGGPPCQAFARVGRAKLREIAEHPDAFKLDERANLYVRYMDYIRECKPLAILMENVPDILNYGGHNIPEEMCQLLEASEYGYVAGYTLLNSAFYGVPQMRERCFLLAYRKELGVNVEFPSPTRYLELPRGYVGSRQVALKHVSTLLGSHYIAPTPACEALPPAVSAKDAIGDLPEITAHLDGRLKRGARRFTELVPYAKDVAPSEYAGRMRNWPEFENSVGVKDHVIRSLPRDYKLFRRMNAGDEYPAAHRLAIALFEERLSELRHSGKTILEDSAEYEAFRKKYVPPYDPGKFPNKWWKLRADRPVRTIMAHIGKDSYSHIHYDSDQARTISVREAARLHSFPDGFVFAGTMNPAFRQIGNAVPPLLSKALAEEVRHTLLSVIHLCSENVAAE